MAALRWAMPTSAEDEPGGRFLVPSMAVTSTSVGRRYIYEGGRYDTLYLQALGGGRYETHITRSRDLRRWQDAPDDRPFLTFDPDHANLPLRPAEVQESNASDPELCYFRGKTIVYFTGSDQQVAGDLQWATCEGTPRDLFEHFFAQGGGADLTAPEHAGD